MELSKRLESTGEFLFRHRGTLPAGTLLLFLFALSSFTYPLHSQVLDKWWELGLIVLSLAGFAVRVASVAIAPPGTSGRNTRQQVADSLNTTGIYSVVRHPLYLGNFLIYLGISMFPRNVWVVAVNVLLFWTFYLPIMIAEERFLKRKFGAAFVEWAQRTPAVIPRLDQWQRSDRRFSVRRAIRREYQTLYAIFVYYTLLEVAGDYFAVGELMLDPYFGYPLAVLTVLYLTVMVVAKRTRWLEDVPQAPEEPEQTQEPLPPVEAT